MPTGSKVITTWRSWRWLHCLTYIRQLGLHPFYYQPDQKFSSTLALSISIYPHCPPPPPHQVFGPSIGPVGDCIALRPLDHFVPVRSTANRIKSFRQHLRFLYRYTPIAPPAPGPPPSFWTFRWSCRWLHCLMSVRPFRPRPFYCQPDQKFSSRLVPSHCKPSNEETLRCWAIQLSKTVEAPLLSTYLLAT